MAFKMKSIAELFDFNEKHSIPGSIVVEKQMPKNVWGQIDINGKIDINKKLTKKQIEYAMNDVLYLSEIKNSLNNKLLNQKRLKMFKSIMKFMEVRVDLDLQGWEEIDIFAHK